MTEGPTAVPARGPLWWAAMVAAVIVFAVACGFLARWQWHRYEDKTQRQQTIARNYDAAPRPVGDVLPAVSTPLPARSTWTPVQVAGRYDVQGQVLVRNRPYYGQYGYEVVVPLQPADGGPALLVDRGWVPNGRTGAAPDAVPPAPSGEVTVVARLKPGEPSQGATDVKGQLGSIHLPTVAQRSGQPMLLGGYGVLARETPQTSPAPSVLPRPQDEGGRGINASYAVQWVLIGVAGLAAPVMLVRRDRRRAEGGEVAARPRKRRIWDDEDE